MQIAGSPAYMLRARPSASSLLVGKLEMPDRRSRLLAMEGMRGFSALIVFFVHFYALFGTFLPAGSWTRSVFQFAASFGHAGVDVFFVLSGFLIYGITLEKRAGYGPFLRRRLVRLYPVFLTVFAIYLAVSFVMPGYSKIPRGGLPAALYILENALMLPGIFNIEPIITVAWSLSYELLFYCSVPLLITLTRMRRWTSPMRIVFFLCLGIGYFALCLLGFGHYPRMVMFAAGILLYEFLAYAHPYLNQAGEVVAILAFGITLTVLGGAGMRAAPLSGIFVSLPPLCVAMLFVSTPLISLFTFGFDGILKGLFSWKYLRWLGNMSYSYYMCHGLTLHLLKGTWLRGSLPAHVSQLAFLGIFALALLATMMCAALLFFYIEKPLSLTSRPTTLDKGRRG